MENMALRIRYGSYEFQVMQCLVDIHDLYELHFPWKVEWVHDIYIDDILVYFKIIEEHLEYVLSKLHENKLFANKAKKEFA